MRQQDQEEDDWPGSNRAGQNESSEDIQSNFSPTGFSSLAPHEMLRHVPDTARGLRRRRQGRHQLDGNRHRRQANPGGRRRIRANRQRASRPRHQRRRHCDPYPTAKLDAVSAVDLFPTPDLIWSWPELYTYTATAHCHGALPRRSAPSLATTSSTSANLTTAAPVRWHATILTVGQSRSVNVLCTPINS